ncbi:MAG: general secretion pathway protein GspK [Desulfobacterales bacterium]|nr:MAG: general secretion pathway protein GspK [Desulfobacterales bacterium]
MISRLLGNNRGIALLVTLGVITVLIVATLEMNRHTRSALFSAAATRDRMTLSQMAASGIHAAKALLITDKNHSNSDSLQEDWADPEIISEILADLPFDDGQITLTISDELGKIQINSLVQFPEGNEFNPTQRMLWDQFLNLLITQNEQFKEIEPETIINSAKDWMDSKDDDAITGLSGAESDYYQDLDPPYSCRNGPFTYLDELALVKGISRDLFQGADESLGISNFLTIHGIIENADHSFTYDGKININTAQLPILAAILPLGHEDLAQAIYDYRQETSDAVYIHDLSSATWYKQVPGLGNIDIDPGLITTSSDIFQLESSAILHAMKLTITAIVKRERDKKTGKWVCKVLRWVTE